MQARKLVFMLAGALLLSGIMPARTRAVAPAALVVGETAYRLLPPELVAAPHVERFAMSDDGRFVLVLRREYRHTPDELARLPLDRDPDPGSEKLALRNNRTASSQIVWRASSPRETITRIDWLSHSHTALAVLAEPLPAPLGNTLSLRRQTLLQILTTGQVWPLFSTAADERSDSLELSLSSAHPLGLLHYSYFSGESYPAAGSSSPAPPDDEVWIVDEVGLRGTPVSLDRRQGWWKIGWTWVGPTSLIPYVTHVPNSLSAVRAPESFSLDLMTRRLARLGGEPRPVNPYQGQSGLLESPFYLFVSHSSARPPEILFSQDTLWLKGSEVVRGALPPRIMVCFDCSSAELLPDGRGVLYLSAGALWLVPIIPRPRAEFDAALKAANEAYAIGGMRTLESAEATYRSRKGVYGTIEDLAAGGLIDPVLGSGQKQGYTFVITLGDPTGRFTLAAAPLVPGQTRSQSFYADETGTIFGGPTGGASPTSSGSGVPPDGFRPVGQ